MRISLFPSLDDPHVRPLETDWNGLIEQLTKKRIIANDKNSVALFCAAEFRDDYREKKNVERVNFLILDFDKQTLESTVASLERLVPYRRILYSTHSHDPRETNGYRFRAVLALDRPVLAREWPSFWDGVRANIAPLTASGAERGPAQAYFLPSCPANRAQFAFAESHDGAVIQVAKYVNALAPEVADGTIRVTPEHLRKLGNTLRRRSSLIDSWMGEALLLIAQGLPFATEGERDDTTWRLCARLAKEIPEASAESLGAVFAASLSLMGADAPTPAIVVEKFSRARSQNAESSKAAAAEDWRESKIRSMFKGKRSDPYSDAELSAWGLQQDEWILTWDKELYIAFDGSYEGPLIRAHDEALQWLSPAPFSVVRLNESGTITYKSIKEMLVEHGKQIRNRTAWIGGHGVAKYDRNTDTLHTYTCPLRNLEPAYDRDVDAFLYYIAGASKPKLETWLASCSSTELRLPLLWLIGPPGVGKSMLAGGIARLWTEQGPGDAHAALGGAFQNEILRCPLLLADERFPTDWRGNVATEQIRSLLTSPTHHINAKYGMQGRVNGMVRLVVASNPGAAEGLSASLKKEDFEALAERILLIDTSAAPRVPSDLAESFVRGDRVARHALWLTSQHREIGKERFAVTGDAGALVTDLFVQGDWRSEILEWICRCLENPEPHITQRKRPAVFAKGGVVYLNRNELGVCWSDYYPGERLNASQQKKVFLAAADLINGSRREFRGVKYSSLESKMLTAYSVKSREKAPHVASLEAICEAANAIYLGSN